MTHAEAIKHLHEESFRKLEAGKRLVEEAEALQHAADVLEIEARQKLAPAPEPGWKAIHAAAKAERESALVITGEGAYELAQTPLLVTESPAPDIASEAGDGAGDAPEWANWSLVINEPDGDGIRTTRRNFETEEAARVVFHTHPQPARIELWDNVNGCRVNTRYASDDPDFGAPSSAHGAGYTPHPSLTKSLADFDRPDAPPPTQNSPETAVEAVRGILGIPLENLPEERSPAAKAWISGAVMERAEQ